VSTDVSEEHIASIFWVEEISSARNQPASRWQAMGAKLTTLLCKRKLLLRIPKK
jgi:hypothetical protein